MYLKLNYQNPTRVILLALSLALSLSACKSGGASVDGSNTAAQDAKITAEMTEKCLSVKVGTMRADVLSKVGNPDTITTQKGADIGQIEGDENGAKPNLSAEYDSESWVYHRPNSSIRVCSIEFVAGKVTEIEEGKDEDLNEDVKD